MYWGAVLIPCGLVLTFFGHKMIQLTFAMLIFFTVAGSIFLFFVLMIFATSLTTTKVVIVTLLSVAAGAAATKYGTKYVTKFGIALLASFASLSAAFLVVPLLGIHGFDYANLVKLVIYVIAGAAGFAGAAVFADGIQVFITSFIGSYMFVRGISFYAGGFINEFEVMQADEGALDDYDIKPFIGYIVGILAVFAGGVIFQKRAIRKAKEEGYNKAYEEAA